jgi:hypothetical protein
MAHRPNRRLLAMALAPVLAALAGCSGSDDSVDAARNATTSTVPAAVTTSTSTTTSLPPTTTEGRRLRWVALGDS